MSTPATLSDLVAALVAEKPKYRRNIGALTLAVNRAEFPQVSTVNQPRPGAALEQAFLALLVAYGIDPVAIAALPTQEGREDAVMQALSDALDAEDNGVKANVDILRDGHRITLLQRQIERSGASLTNPAFGQPTEDVHVTTYARWIDTNNGGAEVTRGEVEAAL